MNSFFDRLDRINDVSVHTHEEIILKEYTPTAALREAANLPKYRCHKEVWAVKIAGIREMPMPEWKSATCRGCFALGNACGNCERCHWERMGGKNGYLIVPTEPGLAPIEVGQHFIAKHKPEIGGYFIVYKDGYQSFSPAQAFEEGYTRIS